MDKIKIIDLKESILADNDRDADMLRETLREGGPFYLNIMSSPGAGKTTTIIKTVRSLRDRLRIGVMEADIDSAVDAETVQAEGIPVVQLHTGGMCHLDADMSRQGMRELGTDGLDLVILENVGNLVCPAEFDTGACLDAVILSVPEGDDKPLKYPLMFEKCSAVLINKIDAMPIFDFDMDTVRKYIAMRNPAAVVFPVSAETGEGIDAWADWLYDRIAEWRK
ncbi:MAG: hydrogenase nickel incorporation protein HypB [Mogibacterium sp.]|nr:hydrogenase nickel incorporation protein HypB [Mogibacterium sp.]